MLDQVLLLGLELMRRKSSLVRLPRLHLVGRASPFAVWKLAHLMSPSPAPQSSAEKLSNSFGASTKTYLSASFEQSTILLQNIKSR